MKSEPQDTEPPKVREACETCREWGTIPSAGPGAPNGTMPDAGESSKGMVRHLLWLEGTDSTNNQQQNTNMKIGIELIAAERLRQIQEEGWTAAHDDNHTAGDLCHAARCYTGHALGLIQGMGRGIRAPGTWPWVAPSWKPSDDPIRDLTKAGALIAAEIDRLLRGGMGKSTTADPWLPIATAPKGQVVDCHNGDSRFTNCVWSAIEQAWMFTARDGCPYKTLATHWMPRPAPPTK